VTRCRPWNYKAIVEEALEDIAPATWLAIIPDKTRTITPIFFFPCASSWPAECRQLTLCAQGTHPPMTEAQKRLKIGPALRSCGLGRIFDHQGTVQINCNLGELSVFEVNKLTDGLIMICRIR